MNDKVNATSGALDLAKEAGIDLSKVSGTGADGKLYKSDVEKYLAEGVGPAPEKKERPSDVGVKTIVRGISKSGVMMGTAYPSFQVDAYVASFVAQGFELVNTHYLGEAEEGYLMMYVLVRK